MTSGKDEIDSISAREERREEEREEVRLWLGLEDGWALFESFELYLNLDSRVEDRTRIKIGLE